MSNFTSRPVLRWAVPAAAAVAVVGAGVAAKTLAVAAEPDLPARTAAQLLVDLQTASLDGLSGTVVERADLGLPAIPLLTGDQSAKLTSLVSGKHTLRVWYSGPDKARVSLLGTQGQSDVIHNGTDTWIWDSQTKEARHFTGRPDREKTGAPGVLASPSDLPKSPQEAADLALKAIDPTTQVTTGNSAKIAGRDAYELILRPRDTSSLVGEVRLAIDAQKKLPLRVQVLPRGTANPAFEVAFTQVSFVRPDDAEFTFNPPAGTKVTEQDPAKAQHELKDKAQQHDGGAADKPKSTVIGTGWTSVLVLRTSDGAQGANAEEQKKAQDAIAQLPQGNGGRTFNSKLLNVLFTDDGRVLVGSVTPERLNQVAADPAAALK
ncbi:hypothetical protein ABT297_22180 [Dactylosporangium sp. NPDC000555]|uniref:LolA family protein n=1 Tax=Dactylosporangium sp. NPDC000555 TaxID=3154260 RepID=UPI00332F258A